jgi:hypothetical protein
MLEEQVMPRKCKGCGDIVSKPKPWISVLVALSPGTGQGRLSLGATEIGRRAKRTKAWAYDTVPKALEAGVIELDPCVPGSRVYQKTRYGHQVLSRWRQAGWKGVR